MEDTVAILSLKTNNFSEGKLIMESKKYRFDLENIYGYVTGIVEGDSIFHGITARPNDHFVNDILIWNKKEKRFPYKANNLKGLTYYKMKGKKCFRQARCSKVSN